MKIQKISLKLVSLVSVIGFLSLGGAAQAALFNFSYTLQGGRVLQGILEGEVQGDNDTVLVSAITNPLFNGNPAPSINVIDSATNVLAGSGFPAVVSLSGSTMDLIACIDGFCSDGFLFESSGLFRVPFYSSGLSYGNTSEEYNAANWSLTAQSVPEPTSVLGILGVGALGATFKRQKKDA